MTWIYRPRGAYSIDPECCAAAVSDGAGFTTHQCIRKGIVEREHEGELRKFCRQHDPLARKAKSDARYAAFVQESNERSRQQAHKRATQDALEACKVAIEAIAAGHNDPNALARETLALFPASLATGMGDAK